MSEVDPGEEETDKKMWPAEKVATLEKENEELRMALREIKAKTDLLGRMVV